MYIVSLLVEHPTHKLDTTYDYLSKDKIVAGVRVSIRFGYQNITGYVMLVTHTDKSKQQLEMESGFRYQYIKEVIDSKPLFNEELQQLSITLSKLSLAPRITCMQAMLPPSLKPATSKQIKTKYQKSIVIVDGTIIPKTQRQQEALEYIKNHPDCFVTEVPFSTAVLDSLQKQGVINYKQVEVIRGRINIEQQENNIQLTDEQQQIVNAILHKQYMYNCSLLHGVTGSGKTEVYLHLASKVIESGKNVIMLVPEISLTPMMVEAFISRFGDKVAVLHSKLSNGERYDQYTAIVNGKVSIVVGARSAIFAPLKNIGLLILDEEHDASYKQVSNPRYYTHQIALIRAKHHQCNLLLASATPSVETYSKAIAGIYDLYELKNRINKRPLPNVTMINMLDEMKRGNYTLFSKKLKNKLEQCIQDGNQAILFLNKRGYSSYVRCIECGSVVECPHCDVTLTYHKENNMLQCHYCNFQTPLPQACPSCHQSSLKKVGSGIQKVEEQLIKEILGAKVIRYDVDTTRHKQGHNKLLEAFKNQEANILLGTQMVAKGLDFENVTFVGVLNADITLNIQDFRANERTFQLLEQVAGRAGRGKKGGEVYIQTMNPEHNILKAVKQHSYTDFYNQEILFRKTASYPPYIHLVSILIESKNEDIATNTSKEIKNYLSNQLPQIKILGPSKSIIYKTNDIYRYRILLKYKNPKEVYPTLEVLSNHYNKQQHNIRVTCDFNPYSQM